MFSAIFRQLLPSWQGVITMNYVIVIAASWFVVYFIFKKYKKQMKTTKKPLEKSAKHNILDWIPDPLVDAEDTNFVIEPQPVIAEGKIGKWVDIGGIKMLNFVSHNYLGFVENSAIINEAKKAICKYGVGSCGPRGFYGTVDVHLELESRICKFMGMESAIVYSYGFSTISSAIASYAKKQDVIFADERVNFAIQRGIEASRSKVFYFKHNDPDDLEALINTWDQNHGNDKKSKLRKFLIVEGLYINTGEICPLPQIIEIRKKYKLRIFIDESISFGILGKTGRGILEHHHVNKDDVDMIMASMEYGLSTGGGFCVGSTFIIEHQRLAGLGYCFSASLPPFLAVAARVGIDIIDQQRKLISKLSKRCQKLHAILSNSVILRNYFIINGDAISPVKHLLLRPEFSSDYQKDFKLLNDIVLYCKYRRILITAAHYLVDKEHTSPPASIRLTVSVTMESEDLSKLVESLEEAANEIFD